MASSPDADSDDPPHAGASDAKASSLTGAPELPILQPAIQRRDRPSLENEDARGIMKDLSGFIENVTDPLGVEATHAELMVPDAHGLLAVDNSEIKPDRILWVIFLIDLFVFSSLLVFLDQDFSQHI
jgi:hypothetical protein